MYKQCEVQESLCLSCKIDKQELAINSVFLLKIQ